VPKIKFIAAPEQASKYVIEGVGRYTVKKVSR
jgi:hypothetical protein